MVSVGTGDKAQNINKHRAKSAAVIGVWPLLPTGVENLVAPFASDEEWLRVMGAGQDGTTSRHVPLGVSAGLGHTPQGIKSPQWMCRIQGL